MAEKPWDLRDASWSYSAGSIMSAGVYMKTELNIDGIDYYLKLSRYDSYRGIYGHESVNELIAYRLGDLLGFNVPEGFLKKSLVRIDGKEHEGYVFAAKSYKSKGSRMAFGDFYIDNRRTEAESPFDLCKRLGWTDYIFKMFIFDYLIINRDRHEANLEVIKNGDKKLSPYFDNGLSFLCSCLEDNQAAAFDIMEDRPVNNFIGEKSLGANLKMIDRSVQFNELRESDRAFLFADIQGILSERFINVIWEILCRRWFDVEKFRSA